MKLIVGLGNPGKEYSGSRHNVGFMVVDALSRNNKVRPKRNFLASSLTARVKIADNDAVLAMPLTFMNLSGVAVKALLKKHRLGLSDLLIVCDDLDLELGRIKIRPAGSSGGHKGLKSIIDSLGSQDFARLRIGIGRPEKDNNLDAADYVLGPFNKREHHLAAKSIHKAVYCCESWVVQDDIEKCMNIFNSKKE